MPRGLRRKNFYEENGDGSDAAGCEGEPEAATVVPQAYETIHVDVDDEDDADDDGPDSTANAESAPPLTTQLLREAVEVSKREIHRIDLLILRAVWKHLIARQLRGSSAHTGSRSGAAEASPSRKHNPRQPELLGKPSLPLTGSCPPHGRAGDDQRPPLSTSLLPLTRDTNLYSFISPTHEHSSHRQREGSARGYNALVFHKKPFLPPSRYPALPELDALEYARFNRNLFRAIVDAGRRGLIDGHRGNQRSAARHAAGRKGERTALLRSLFARPDNQPLQLMPSLRGAATRKAGGEGAPGTSQGPWTGAAAEVAPVLSLEDAEAEWTPSLAILILQVARERAVATLFLRQLRLDAQLRRERLQEVELRFQYFLQRRVLGHWHLAARQLAERRRFILSTCIRVWSAAVADSRRLRESLAEFRRGLAQRNAAFAACERSRKARYLQQWRSNFTARRVERSLYAMASAFQERRRVGNHHHCPRFVRVVAGGTGEASGVLLTEVSPAFARARVVAQLFGHWRRKAEARNRLCAADQHYTDALRRRVVTVMRGRVAGPAAALAERRAALRETVREAVERGTQPDVGALLPSRRRTLTVHVDGAPAHTFRYKEASATRIAQSRVLRDSFCHWRTRAMGRSADKLRAEQLRVAVLRQWLLRLGQRRQSRERLGRLWALWRGRCRANQDSRLAEEVCRRSVLRRVFAAHWRARFLLRVAERREVALGCLQQWWTRASLRAATRILHQRRRETLFQLWRQRAALRLRCKTSELVADTVREAILLFSCLRWWRDRAEQARHMRLSLGVLAGLGSEKSLASCFAKWKRKTFGPCSPPPPPPLPAPPPRTPTASSAVDALSCS